MPESDRAKRELSEVAHSKGALFHTDAVQAVGHTPVNVETLGDGQERGRRSGIEIATGSACDLRDTQISHVLTAIGFSEEYAKGTIRISLGAANTKEEVDVIVTHPIQIVESMNEGR